MTQKKRLERTDLGVLVANLGTPEKADRRSVSRFLRQFLSDPRVVDLPRWLWLPLLNIVIIPLRAARSAAAYRSIWWQEGSPLLVLTQRLVAKLADRLTEICGVAVAMRYGLPSIQSALSELQELGAKDIIILPLFPQFSYTTTASVFDAVDAALLKMQWKPSIIRIEDYHRHPAWVEAVAASILDFRSRAGGAQMLLFSLHGIPQRYVSKGDPYASHCREGMVAIAHAAGLRDEEWRLTFQSRVGREPWLTPYTDVILQELAIQGVRHVQVICPGFAVDCLETLEEIAMQNREMFETAGGERLEYIPALNDSDAHAAVLKQLVEEARGR